MEHIVSDVSQRAEPALEALSSQFQALRGEGRSQTRTAPAASAGLLHELAAREVQLEDSLRLHRERLRQVSENNEREVRRRLPERWRACAPEFEVAHKVAPREMVRRIESETDTRVARSSGNDRAPAEWLRQEARRACGADGAIVLTAKAGLLPEGADAAQKFETQVAAQSAAHLGQFADKSRTLQQK